MRPRAVPLPAGRRGRPRAQAKDHRRDLHRGVRTRGRPRSATPPVPGPGHDLPRSHRVGLRCAVPRRRSRRTTTSAALPERMKLKLVEPLRDLFKDEVRRVGEELGLDRRVRRPPPVSGAGTCRANPRRGDARAGRAVAGSGRRFSSGSCAHAGTLRLRRPRRSWCCCR